MTAIYWPYNQSFTIFQLFYLFSYFEIIIIIIKTKNMVSICLLSASRMQVIAIKLKFTTPDLTCFKRLNSCISRSSTRLFSPRGNFSDFRDFYIATVRTHMQADMGIPKIPACGRISLPLNYWFDFLIVKMLPMILFPPGSMSLFSFW